MSKRGRPETIISGDALDDDFYSPTSSLPVVVPTEAKKSKTSSSSLSSSLSAPLAGRFLSKRQARKGRAIARAAGVLPILAEAKTTTTSGVGGGGGRGSNTTTTTITTTARADAPTTKFSKFDSAASTIIPWASPIDLAASLWALFRASQVGSGLTELEYVTPLNAEGVKPYSESLRGSSAGNIVRAVLSRTVREAAGESRGLENAAAPALLLVTHSAPRAAALLRELSVFKTRIGKIFSSDAAAGLRVGPPISICVGTPHRIRSVLAEGGALSLEKCRIILLDAAPDAKKLCLLTERASREDWWGLYSEVIHQLVTSGQTKLAVLA